MTKFVNKTARGRAMFAAVHKPIDTFAKDGTREFKITLAMNESNKDDLVQVFKDQNVPLKVNGHDRIKESDNGEFLVSFKKPEFNKQGLPNKILVVDSLGDEIPPNILIGNGSEVEVTFTLFSYVDQRSKKELSSYRLMGVQVIDLVKYESTGPRISKTFKGGYVTDKENKPESVDGREEVAGAESGGDEDDTW